VPRLTMLLENPSSSVSLAAFPTTRLFFHQACFHSTCAATPNIVLAFSTPISGSFWNANFATK
ncbi:MAG: hypothetical protein ACKPKO_19480, partial [Candidatus Fonsibacter sp.]